MARPSSTAASATGPAAAGPSPSHSPPPWSESQLWEEAFQSSCGADPVARAALARSLEGLHTLLPDLRPHWREQVAVHQRLLRIEAQVGAGAGARPPEGPGTPAPETAAPGAAAGGDAAAQPRVDPAGGGAGPPCFFAAAQVAYAELQALKAFFKSYGNRTAAQYHSRSMWALSEALLRAPAAFSSGPEGPESCPPVLLRAEDLGAAAAEVRVLRRAHGAHLAQLAQAQVDLARRLPELARLLVQLRQERPEQGVDVSRKVATNLLLLQRSFTDARQLDRLSLILELDAQEAWRRAARGH